jgi:hypothetical protein
VRSAGNPDVVDVALAAHLRAAMQAAAKAGTDPVAFAAGVLIEAYNRRALRSLETHRKAVLEWRTRRALAKDKRDAFALYSAERAKKGHAERLDALAKNGTRGPDELTRSKLARELYEFEERALAAGLAMTRTRAACDLDCENARAAALELADLLAHKEPSSPPAGGGWEYTAADVERIRREVLESDAREALSRERPRFAVREVVKAERCGPFYVLTRTDGRSVVCDERLPFGQRTVEQCPSLRLANAACTNLGAREGFVRGEGAEA